jgi:hypothetical protein
MPGFDLPWQQISKQQHRLSPSRNHQRPETARQSSNTLTSAPRLTASRDPEAQLVHMDTEKPAKESLL